MGDRRWDRTMRLGDETMDDETLEGRPIKPGDGWVIKLGDGEALKSLDNFIKCVS